MRSSATAAGPELASAPGVLDRLPPERWQRALAAAVDRRWARSRTLLFLTIYACWALFCVALWREGFPRWRIGVLAGILLATAGYHVRQSRVCGPSLPEGDGRWRFGFLLLATAITGGLHSPLLVGITGHFTGVLVRRGWSRETRLAMFAFIGGAAVMAVAPMAWVGPRIPEPTFTNTVIFVLVLSVVVQVDYMVMVMRTAGDALRQLLRSREEHASAALARAAELERLSSHLSHELKNPLGAIKALVQLSVRSERDPEIRTRLEVVDGEVERMQAILQGYLSFSRPLETLRPEPVALGPLADEVLAILEARAEAAKVALARDGDAAITGDPRRLKEAFLNLVANAIEATPAGGRVDVRIASAADAARVEVRDTGRGMDPTTLSRLGTPFFTTREEGTGLGVLLARSVVVQHGGTLGYASERGRGTVATVRLPVACTEGGADGARAAGR